MYYYSTTLHQTKRTSGGYEQFDIPAHLRRNSDSPNVTTRSAKKPSLFRAMVRAFGLPFVVAGFLKLIGDVLSFVGPQILK